MSTHNICFPCEIQTNNIYLIPTLIWTYDYKTRPVSKVHKCHCPVDPKRMDTQIVQHNTLPLSCSVILKTLKFVGTNPNGKATTGESGLALPIVLHK